MNSCVIIFDKFQFQNVIYCTLKINYKIVYENINNNTIGIIV